MRRNGVSPFFFSLAFYFRCCSSTLTQSLACKGYVTGKKISYFPFAFTDDVISAFILHFESLLPDTCFLSLSRCCKKTAPEATVKINIWRASIKLVWRVCFICVFCSCRTNARIFYALCKGTTFKKNFLCFRRALGAMQQEWTGGGGTRLIFGYRFEILTLFRTKNSLNSYPV